MPGRAQGSERSQGGMLAAETTEGAIGALLRAGSCRLRARTASFMLEEFASCACVSRTHGNRARVRNRPTLSKAHTFYRNRPDLLARRVACNVLRNKVYR
ncbi:hypothetical protein MC885_018989 [Smutsia gigantea]|nr:hypothetical protein MC885_018989 [Smutsia gigantea]